MSYAEDLLKLRKRVVDAVGQNVFDSSSKDIIEAMLIQIMNDAERNRQQCLAQAEGLRKQASQIDGQAGAFASVSSIVYNVLNGFIKAAEKVIEEDNTVLIKSKQDTTENKPKEPKSKKKR
jgi:hypothetical protein